MPDFTTASGNRLSLSLEEAAILVWLPLGITPARTNFDLKNIQTPPSPNPEAFWLLGEAIIYAMTVIHPVNHGKQPWIKVGERVLDPEDVRAFFATMQAIKANAR
ncbi:hypothetical protein HCU64_06620 [Methylobacterium sp. C25]|uniref:hypothetical protein n=1 Tax=Methylobacterium sp. C25 TaxID=2721622 RepID=UPI001F40974A|nr:hypothetical protein [Methylobacterium sp. C25]MCE4223419.1 hypothetical protein [Methylobacterium sp. C25]